jgi:hypothetical protein
MVPFPRRVEYSASEHLFGTLDRRRTLEPDRQDGWIPAREDALLQLGRDMYAARPQHEEQGLCLSLMPACLASACLPFALPTRFHAEA